uniref:UBC core domain-containing protein n=1 Tax=Setaria digitata TaxID=48799 RepID=A0A915PN05_9BILA
MKEAAELRNPTDMYYAQPLEDNLFEWHFTVRGPVDTDFEGGIYHGRILLPVDYPMKPPSVILLTVGFYVLNGNPNGRFQLNQKICLSISGHHPESWQPSWSIRTALLALIGFMPTHAAGALGSLEYPPEERRRLAKKSHDWVCKECGLCMRNALASEVAGGDNRDAVEARLLATRVSFKEEKERKMQEGMSDQNLLGQIDLAARNDVRMENFAATPGTLFHRRSSIQPCAASITSVPSNDSQLRSRGYSWELLCIWFFSVIVLSLVLRRFFLAQQNGAVT